MSKCNRLIVKLGLTVVLCITWPSSRARGERQASLTSREVVTAIKDLTSPDADARTEAYKMLAEQPCLSIGPPLAEMLDADISVLDPEARTLAFEALSTCTGRKTPEVEGVLLAGLRDDVASVVYASAKGLSTASRAAKAEGAAIVTERWDRWVKPSEDPAAWKVEVVRYVGALGPLVNAFAESEGDARKTLLWVVGMLGAKTNGVFDGNSAYQQAIRKFVVDSFDSPSKEVRKAAFQGLVWSFGENWVVIQSATDYEINPELIEVINDIAANDPDEELREAAARLPDVLRDRYLDRAVETILRSREGQENNAHKRPPSSTP